MSSLLTPRSRNACTPYGDWTGSTPGGGDPVPGVAPVITVNLSNATVTEPATATFTIAATGTGPLTYLWTKNSSVISGAIGSSYTTPATNVSMSGDKYQAVVSNPFGSAQSVIATLTVNPGTPASPGITLQPVGFSGQALTGSYTMTAEASGSPAPTWKWYESIGGGASTEITATGPPGFPYLGSVSSSPQSTLIFDMQYGPDPVSPAQVSRNFFAIATNASGSAQSDNANALILPRSANVTVAVTAAAPVFLLGKQPVVTTGGVLTRKRATSFVVLTNVGGLVIGPSNTGPALLGTGTATLKTESYRSGSSAPYTGVYDASVVTWRITGWSAYTFGAAPLLYLWIPAITLLPGYTAAGVKRPATITIKCYEGTTQIGATQTWTSDTFQSWLDARPSPSQRFITFSPSTSIPTNLRVEIAITGYSDLFHDGPEFVYLDNFIQISDVYVEGV